MKIHYKFSKPCHCLGRVGGKGAGVHSFLNMVLEGQDVMMLLQVMNSCPVIQSADSAYIALSFLKGELLNSMNLLKLPPTTLLSEKTQ